MRQAESELLTRVGPGTAMGALLRRYWIPAVQSKEIEPGGPRILVRPGQQLVRL